MIKHILLCIKILQNELDLFVDLRVKEVLQ